MIRGVQAPAQNRVGWTPANTQTSIDSPTTPEEHEPGHHHGYEARERLEEVPAEAERGPEDEAEDPDGRKPHDQLDDLEDGGPERVQDLHHRLGPLPRSEREPHTHQQGEDRKGEHLQPRSGLEGIEREDPHERCAANGRRSASLHALGPGPIGIRQRLPGRLREALPRIEQVNEDQPDGGGDAG